MILPVVALPSLDAADVAQPLVDALTSRLGALSEVVLSGSGDAGGVDAAMVKGYRPLLRECPCRVGPFEVLSGDRDTKVPIVCISSYTEHKHHVIVRVPCSLSPTLYA